VQQLGGDFLVDRVVFGQQDALARMLGAQPRRVCAGRRLRQRQRHAALAQHARQHVLQRGTGDRLDQHRVEVRLVRRLPHADVVGRCRQDRRRRALAQHDAQLLQRGHAVQRRHVRIEQQQVVATARRQFGLRQRERGRCVGQRIDLDPMALQPALQRGARLGQVVDDQRTHRPCRCWRGRLDRRGTSEPGGEPERAALSGLAGDTDVAPHHVGQMARQRQAQAGAAVAARGGRIRLHEGAEQPRLQLRRDALAGVFHLEADQQALSLLLQAFAAQAHPAAPGELHRIGEQVDQGLRQARGIAAQ
jgi:hypothetical protein